MKNEAEIIWWKTVKQDVETTPPGFTEAAARAGETGQHDGRTMRRPRYEPISIEPMRRRELAVDSGVYQFGLPPKLPADRFARITFFMKYEITYRNFCGGRGGLWHE
ncbi:hypothetical protein X777_08680 [Ooceraea biroi]|uniref:Uncharacterized protein n=1 Tax=Ooceraea biroi TaxID=2015173 RepID=A0A026W881_OOCBI|nr:hypothetical protein X777_08680 [Ooceraea biroi]